MKPELVDQAMRTAVGHHQSGRLREARQIYRQVLAEFPNHPEALHLLGVLTNAEGRADEAIQLIRRAIEINPENPLYHSNLGVAFRDQGRFDEAIAALNRALQLNPNYAEACNHLGNAMRDAGRSKEAIAAYRKALQMKPGFAVVYSNLGNLLRDSGEIDQAIEAFREALRLQPDYAAAYRNLGNALHDRGNQDEAIVNLRKAVALAPDDAGIHSSLLFALAHHADYDEAAIAREQRLWVSRHTRNVAGLASSFLNEPAPDRRLKVAYISKYFCDCADFHYILPVVANHNHAQFEISLYSDVVQEDQCSELARSLAAHWHRIVGMSDQRVAELICDHRIDIAVVILPGNRLLAMARKPAPLSMAWLFSASSSGMSAIDYRASDPHLDPPDSDESFYSEKTLRLPETAWCYDPLITGVDISPQPAVTNGFITFGSLNRVWKINDAVLARWTEILKAIPQSRLLLLAAPGGARQRLWDAFSKLGIDPSHIQFVSRQPRREYLQTYNQIDIVLDTFPYNGHTTSLDAMWMGVPVVTLAHRRPVGRVGASLLANLGLGELIAQNAEEFVAIATRLAGDLSALSALRARLRSRLEASPLMNAAGFTKNLEAAYRHVWRHWCLMRAVDLPKESVIS